MKKITTFLLMAVLLWTLAACGSETLDLTAVDTAVQPAAALETAPQTDSVESVVQPTAVPVSVDYEEEDLTVSETNSATTTILLNGDAVSVDGEGVAVDGSVVTITAAGTYSLSGSLNNGQIVVDTQDEETVNLILNGVNLSCATSAPIYVRNAEKTVLTLADGTDNIVTDGSSYVFPDAETDEPNAAVFSNDDLTINGGGSLTVQANYNNGIDSDDDLKITGGTITVSAVNDGIKGRDSIAVLDGQITVNAGGDGLQSNNDEDAEKGYVSIEGGVLDITAVADGIQAETQLNISGGTLNIVTGADSDSAKGLKAGVDITISGGTMAVDAADDAVHANGSITINGGDIVLASGDDAVHADAQLVINGGSLDITRSYEGLESAIIVINDGTVHIVASDDGINVAGESGGFGPGSSASTSDYLEINGGTIIVDSGGDGLDSNGSGTLNGGVVLVNGPIQSNNGSLDVDGTLVINGGFLVAVGSAGMAQAPGTDSTQYSVLELLPSVQPAGTPVNMTLDTGVEIVTFVPTKEYQSIVVSSSDLTNGATYTLSVGGSVSGAAENGLVTDGSYAGGTAVATTTISSVVTGSSQMMGRGGNRGTRP